MILKKILIAFFFLLNLGLPSLSGQTLKQLADIPIRDPFIMPHKKSGYYYMYKSAMVKELGGVEVYKSKDLKNWEGPIQAFEVSSNNWITGWVWAPEVHEYKGKYYLFATLNSDTEWQKSDAGWPKYTFRASQIFVSKSPEGPFLPFSEKPHTPMDKMALDGTLWVEDGRPYMVYCNEWVQTVDGTMELVELAPDLSAPVGYPVTLFHASVANWSTGSEHSKNGHPVTAYVTDGCFLYRTKTGKLLMIWSSYMNGKYAVGIAESVTGRIHGPWKQQEKLLVTEDGGHGMIFKTFTGKLCITFHRPNWPGGKERAHIFELEDSGDTLRLLGELRP